MVTDLIRAGLLLHCSTADETWFKVDKIGWLSDGEGEITRQGLGFIKQGTFISDFFEELSSDERIIEIMRDKFPELTASDVEDAMFFIWHLLSATQYFKCLNSVENEGVLDTPEKDALLENCMSKWKLFKADPYDFLGIEKDC